MQMLVLLVALPAVQLAVADVHAALVEAVTVHGGLAGVYQAGQGQPGAACNTHTRDFRLSKGNA